MSRLSGIDASADRLRVQLAAADAALSDRDATLQLLTADKAYLSKEVQVGCCIRALQNHLCLCADQCTVSSIHLGSFIQDGVYHCMACRLKRAGRDIQAACLGARLSSIAQQIAVCVALTVACPSLPHVCVGAVVA